MNDIHHNHGQQRFEHGDAQLTYARPTPQVIDLLSVQVPPHQRGQGLAARLVQAAFAHAKEHNLRVVPTCSYISGAFLKRHPEYLPQTQPPSAP